MAHIQEHEQNQELIMISNIIDSNSTICQHILQDLNRGKVVFKRTGADGMSADQILRCAVVKTLFNFSYKALAFHIVDSESLRWFCRIGFAGKGFKKSTLNGNIKCITAQTWELINHALLGFAEREKIEKGRTVRTDCTCVESNIHSPSDSTLLWDGVRVLTRLIEKMRNDFGIKAPCFTNHTRRAKRRMMAVMHAKSKKQRKAAYTDLLKMADNVLGYSRTALTGIIACASNLELFALSEDIKNYLVLLEKVVDQTRRRVILGETVPSPEKVVSIFEPHTDIIKKDRRDTYYGHKICLTGGASNLILDCLVATGNPADTDLAVPMLDRQKEIYGRYPLKASFDGGFASKNNLKEAKSRQVKDVCFAKKRGLEETDMCRSEHVYHRLRNFRAGIESGISWLKRCMGLTRCTWKGWESFKSYVWSSIVAANLLTLARHRLNLSTA